MALNEQPEVKILDVRSGYAKHTYTVHLNGAARAQYRDQQIINIVDAGGDLSRADDCSNFGGTVRPKNGVYEVVVYFD